MVSPSWCFPLLCLLALSRLFATALDAAAAAAHVALLSHMMVLTVRCPRCCTGGGCFEWLFLSVRLDVPLRHLTTVRECRHIHRSCGLPVPACLLCYYSTTQLRRRLNQDVSPMRLRRPLPFRLVGHRPARLRYEHCSALRYIKPCAHLAFTPQTHLGSALPLLRPRSFPPKVSLNHRGPPLRQRVLQRLRQPEAGVVRL